MLDSRVPTSRHLRELVDRLASCLSSGASIEPEAARSRSITSGGDASLIPAYEAAIAVASEVELDAVLQRIADEAAQLLGAGAAILTTTNVDDDIGHVVVGGPLRDPAYAGPTLSTDGRWAATKLRPGSRLLVPDVTRPLGRETSISSLVGVPLALEESWSGNLFVVNPAGGRAFDEHDARLLDVLAQKSVPSILRAARHQSEEFGQEQVGKQLAQLRSIIDTLPAGVMVVLPPDGRIEACNRTGLRMMFGREMPSSTIPQVYRDFRWLGDDGEDLPRSRHPGMLALRGELIPNRALILQDMNGERIPVRVQSAPIHDSAGKVVRAVVMFLDVSRERAAEQVKDDFLSLISHEFRTPLTAIHGGAHLLAQQGEGLDEETRAELLRDIGEESQRLDRMLGNLLSVAEIMAGRFQASTEPILVAPFVQAIVDEFRRQAQEHELVIDAESGLPPAEGDPELLIQILRNLYENAVKYSPGGGEIRTVIRQEGSWVSISVIDQGLGIAHDHVPQVFERFRRPGADPTVRGMGLGLYLSRLLVDAQGGRIRAASDGPGKGATFVVEMPISPDWDKDMAKTPDVERRA